MSAYHSTGNYFIAVVVLSILTIINVLALPEGPSELGSIANETGSNVSALIINNSQGGGYIYTINITVENDNPRWKAYVGNISGTLVLQDSTGAKVYDWSLSASLSGEVYATRNATTVSWGDIRCANATLLEQENSDMSHTNPSDNISLTFNASTPPYGSHSSFVVGSISIDANSCPTTNTYVNNGTQDTSFEEVVLGVPYNTSLGNYSYGGVVVYATLVESDVTGFDNQTYDFQMIVPENGADGFTGSTAYYFYTELI